MFDESLNFHLDHIIFLIRSSYVRLSPAAREHWVNQSEDNVKGWLALVPGHALLNFNPYFWIQTVEQKVPRILISISINLNHNLTFDLQFSGADSLFQTLAGLFRLWGRLLLPPSSLHVIGETMSTSTYIHSAPLGCSAWRVEAPTFSLFLIDLVLSKKYSKCLCYTSIL